MWLGIVVGAVCAVQRLMAVFDPSVILPQWDVSALAAFSVIALLLEGMTDGRTRSLQRRAFNAVLAAVIFATYPALSGTWEAAALWKMAVAGGVIYAAAEEMIEAMEDRMISGGRGKIAVAVNGLILILASQAFDHIIF